MKPPPRCVAPQCNTGHLATRYTLMLQTGCSVNTRLSKYYCALKRVYVHLAEWRFMCRCYLCFATLHCCLNTKIRPPENWPIHPQESQKEVVFFFFCNSQCTSSWVSCNSSVIWSAWKDLGYLITPSPHSTWWNPGLPPKHLIRTKVADKIP